MTEPVIDIADLPPMLQHWVELSGLDAVMRLVQRFGGTRVYIPMPEHITPDHWLAQELGVEAARAVAKAYTQEILLVPMATQALEKLKENLIRIDLGNGLSVRDIALKHRVHERRVWRIKATAQRQCEAPDPQQYLF